MTLFIGDIPCNSESEVHPKKLDGSNKGMPSITCSKALEQTVRGSGTT